MCDTKRATYEIYGLVKIFYILIVSISWILYWNIILLYAIIGKTCKEHMVLFFINTWYYYLTIAHESIIISK